MSTNLTKRSTFLFINNLLENFLKILSGFFVTPIIIIGLSKELYGAWSMILQLLNYIALTNLRSSTTLKITIAANQHGKDYEYKRRQIGAAVKMWLITLPITILVSGVIIVLSKQIFKTEGSYDTVIRIALLCSILAFTVDQLFSISGNLMRGSNLDYKGFGVKSMVIIMAAGLNILAIKLNFNIIGLSIANLIAAIISGIIWYYLVKKYIPWFGISKPTSVEMSEYRKNTFHIFLSSIGSLLLLSSDAFLLGTLVNTKVVAVYMTTCALPRMFIFPISNVVSSANAGLAGLCGSGQWERVLMIRKEIQNIVLFIFFLFSINFLLVNKSFLGLWVGDGFHGGEYLDFLFVLSYLLFLIQMIDIILLDGLQEYRVRSRVYLIGGAIVLALSVVIVPWLGMEGMAGVLIIARLFTLISFRYFLSKKLEVKLMTFFTGIGRPLIVASIIYLGLSYFNWEITNWLLLILDGLIISILSGILLYYLGFSSSNRKLMLDRLKIGSKIIHDKVFN